MMDNRLFCWFSKKRYFNGDHFKLIALLDTLKIYIHRLAKPSNQRDFPDLLITICRGYFRIGQRELI